MGAGKRTVGEARLDEKILAQLREVGGEDLVHELMRLYLTHTPERMLRARRELARGDLASAAKAIHSLRSSSATLGASELAGLLARVETAADAADGETVGRWWPEVEERVTALLAELERRIVAA